MSAATSIQWTDTTWNPVRGCSIVSPGCVNCYAMKQAHRFSGPGKPYHGLTKFTERSGPQWTGVVRTVEDALLEPLSWRKPARVFVNSMSDLFHEDVPDAFLDKVFAVMALAPQHTFQILTKRAERMRDYLTAFDVYERIAYEATVATSANVSGIGLWPLRNCWLGISAEDQQRADERIPLLLQTPAAVRFVSAEPLLGPIDFSHRGKPGGLPIYWEGTEADGPLPHYDGLSGQFLGYSTRRGWARYSGKGIDWLIVGGESGPGARPMDLEWARSIVQQCKAAGVACFVKQLGSCITGLNLDGPPYSSPPRREGVLVHWTCKDDNTFGLGDRKGGDPAEWPEDLRVREWPREQPRPELVHG
jgi:protein gp37